MSAIITRGTSFTSGQKDITVAQFNPLLTAATIAGVDRANCDGDTKVATYQAAAPSNPVLDDVWQDPITGLLKSFSAVDYVPAIEPAASFDLSPTAPESIAAGMVLMPSQDLADIGTERVQACNHALRFAAVGVSADTVAPGGSGRLVRRGACKVKVASVCVVGHGGRVSTTNGLVEDTGDTGLGVGVLGVFLTVDSGGYAWINLRA